ncbi:hypothetical protein THAOC_37885 [Thalassiosira oceanica]|uniref:Uncharacterized protein n=1 Tax=Thalassiosira oceanica TaxID=159749 RepID=K0R567_THAOC|nr:hypothetical protein THAOC_37885 [Thalassiosira oceanica]|eukprot:EJK43651.1 hypothetical protein THAOC_37885 [Thalassiosira oceanica]
MALAQEIEDAYVSHSEDDGDGSLGLELVDDAERRRGWGRLVRAPLKKGRHVVLDYCSAGVRGMGGEDGAAAWGGSEGRITRQRVSRGWSARSAPGTYQAARKARWGGLWPDLGGGEGVLGDGDDGRF